MKLRRSDPNGLVVIALVCILVRPASGDKYDFSPKRAFLVSKSEQFIAQDAENSLTLYRLQDGKGLHSFCTKAPIVTGAVTRDGKRILISSQDNRFGLWDVLSGRRLWWNETLATTDHVAVKVQFAADGRRFLAFPLGGPALIHETETGKLIRSVGVPAPDRLFVRAAFSADGSRGFLTEFDGDLFAFDVATGSVTKSNLTRSEVVYSVDGKYMAIATGRSIRVVTTADFRTKREIVPQRPGVPRATEEGGFVWTAYTHDATTNVIWVAATQYLPGTNQLKEVWKFQTDPTGVTAVSDFSSETMLGVSTDYRFVTTVLDLKTGKPRLVIDNSANYRPRLISSSSRGGK